MLAVIDGWFWTLRLLPILFPTLTMSLGARRFGDTQSDAAAVGDQADDAASAPTTPSYTPTADDQANINSLGGTDPHRLHDLMND